MSATIDTLRTEDAADAGTKSTLPPAAWLDGDALDVSELSFDRVAAYARRADGEVYLERKAGRTRLVAA